MTHVAGPGTAQNLGCIASQVEGKGRVLGVLTPSIADWMWNVTSLAGKKPWLVREVGAVPTR